MGIDLTIPNSNNLSGTVQVSVSVTPIPKSVSLHLDGTNANQKIGVTDWTKPFIFSWNTTTVSDGNHILYAVVVYKNNTRVAQLSVTVANNSLPPPPDEPPPPGPQAAPTNIDVPEITGTATEGQTLYVSQGTWTNSPTSYTRQWLRCDATGANPVAIPSATGASYVLVALDVDATIRCQVTAYNIPYGASPAVVTAQTAVVAELTPAVPVLITGSEPVITGSTSQGQSLVVSNGGWTNFPTSYTYQWRRCNSSGAVCSNISGATSTSYLLTALDVGSTIRCQVTAANGAGPSASPATTAQTAVVITSPAPPPTGLPFAEAALRYGYNSLTVPATEDEFVAPAGKDCLINLQNIVRGVPLLIWGYSGQRIKVINGNWNITKPIDGSPYWRGGPRVRTVDGIGPEHISFTDCIVRGSTIADAMAIAAGSQTKVTIQRCRFESPYQTTGANTAEPAEHPDAIHLQGNVRVIEIGLTTLFAASVNSPNDGGKCIMLNDDWSPNYVALYLNQVNMRGQGVRTGTFLYQDNPTMDINLTNVYAHKEGSGAFVWSGGSGLFYPNNSAGAAVAWTSSGSAPNREADWPDAASIYGVIKEGLPPSGDYSTRAHFGL